MLILIFIYKWIWRIFIKQINAYTIDMEISLNSVDFYFSICLPLIFLSLLIAPVSRQQLFEHNIEKERAMTSLDCFIFPPFRMMLIVEFLTCCIYCVEYCPFLARCPWDCYYEGILDFGKGLISIFWDDHVMFVSIFIYVVNFTYWLVYFESSLHLCDYKHLGHGRSCFRAVSGFSLQVTLRNSFESLFPVYHEPMGCSSQTYSKHLLQRTTLMFSNVSN